MARQTGTYLDRILADTAAALAARTDLPTEPSPAPPARGFECALLDSAWEISLIAEVKKASPSRGVIRPDFHPAQITREYEAAGAQAISVLTNEKYFQGKLSYLDEVRAACALPLLRKDFIIHPAQIFETVGRADAVLLIVAALEKAELSELFTLAAQCGLDVLMEVHDRAELEIAEEIGAPIVGINNRNLHTFEVDIRTTINLLKYVEGDELIISESGIRDRLDVLWMRDAGADALLIGETLMASNNIEKKIRELFRY